MSSNVLNRSQASKLGAMGATLLGKKLGLKGAKLALAGKAGSWAAGKAAKAVAPQITRMVGLKKGGVIVMKEAPKKKRGRKSKK